MLEKMNDAEKLNEVNALYEEMMQQVKMSSIEQLARRQVDGVVRQREAGYDDFLTESVVPSSCKHVLEAHAGGCGSILFEHNSNRLLTGGQDCTVKVWDASTGILSDTLRGSVGSILDIAVTHDAKFVVGASSSNNLCVWETSSGRVRHTLTGHTDKVCGVDATRCSSRNVVSAAYDHTIKVWDLHKGYCTHTIVSSSNLQRSRLQFRRADHMLRPCGRQPADVGWRLWEVDERGCGSLAGDHVCLCVSKRQRGADERKG